MAFSLQSVLEELGELEPFPSAAVRVMELSMAGEPDPVELALVIKMDVGMTAKVLKLANSAVHSTIVEITSIEQAAVKLGSDELARLAMTCGAAAFYSGLGSSTPRSNKSLWEESVTNAIAARLVAQDRGRERPDTHYTIGLLMNMGHVVLDRFLRIQRESVLAKIDCGARALRAERDVLGITHAELGSRMARRWGFPSALVDAIANHHTPDRGEDPELCADVNLAEALTWEAMREDESSPLAYGVSGATVGRVGVVQEDVDAIRAALPVAVEAQRYLMGMSDAA